MRAEDDVEAETKARPPDEPCRCGRHMLQHWWAAVTDAGDEGTDYKRHSREECLTQTERNARRAPLPVAPGYWEGRIRQVYADWVRCGTDEPFLALCQRAVVRGDVSGKVE
jgi:hypothetical protein